MRRKLAPVFAVVALLFGVAQELKIRLISLGQDLLVRTDPPQGISAQQLSVAADSGDLDYLLRIKVRALPSPPSLGFRALLADGRELKVDASEGNGVWSLQVSDFGSGASTTFKKFNWPSGIPLVVVAAGSPQPSLALEDWELYPNEGSSDSSRLSVVMILDGPWVTLRDGRGV